MEEFARLCCHIVEDFYGSFLAQIFRQLTQLGRLSINQIAQKCRLPLRQVKVGVATLIQLRLVYHHTTPEGLSTYQANTTNAYNIMRTGRVIELVEWKFGSSAANIMELLAAMGFATAYELETQVFSDEDLSKSIDRSRFRALLKQLIASKYIMAVREAHFQSVFDSRQDAERFLLGHGMLSTGAGKKTKIDAEAKIDLELEKRVDSNISAVQVLRELDTGSSEDNIMLSIDYSNLIIRTRNDRITEIAENIFGRQVAQVARAACLQVEDLDPRPLPIRLAEEPANATQRLDISKLIPLVFGGTTNREDNQNGWLAEDHLVNGNHGLRVNGTTGEQQIIEHHLAALAQGSFSFLSEDPTTRCWLIDKSKFDDFLWDKEMNRLIGESVSQTALRIVRMLADKGKLDEKAMQDVGLLNAKDLRKSLAQLQTLGFLELQEVPKDPQRQPKSTFFLYFYDAERVRKVFLDKLCKAMSRLYQRLHLEREKHSSTLSKVERSDVQGSEQQILSAGELRLLYRWRQKECWFTAEMHRIDDSIVILREI